MPLIYGPGEKYNIAFKWKNRYADPVGAGGGTYGLGGQIGLRARTVQNNSYVYDEILLSPGNRCGTESGSFNKTIDFSMQNGNEGLNVYTGDPIVGDYVYLYIYGIDIQGFEITDFIIEKISVDSWNISKKELASVKLYVDANGGSDSHDGKSLQTPVKTLAKAQELVRGMVDTVNTNVTVYIRGGVYVLTQPLNFNGDLDSLAGGKTITYKSYDNEKAYISGGVALDSWSASEYGNNIVKATMPEGVDTRDLYVNGQSAVRARTDGSLTDLVEWSGGLEVTYHDGGALAQSGGEGTEVVFKSLWMDYRGGVSSAKVVGNSSVLTLDSSFHFLLQTIPFGLPDKSENVWFIENSMNFLDKPGEWYYDKAEKVIYYKLRNGETVDDLNAYAGVSEKLITSNTKSTLKNITFEGLTFCNTSWLRPQKPGGYVSRQAAFYAHTSGASTLDMWQRPEAAITLYQTDGVKFINNQFINLGNCAIDMERAKNARLSGNLFTDCGGSAVILAGFDPYTYHSPDDESIITENCELSNNYIYNIGTNMQSACGISVGYSRNIDIVNNTLHDLPYSGISQGWGWGIQEFDNPPKSSGGRIANNLIYNVMLKLDDGGAIYTQSRRDGLVIENNYVHHVMQSGTGIYQDNRSAGYTIRNNVVHDNAYNLVQNSYNTAIYDNYLDGLTQTTADTYVENAKVIFYGWKLPDGQYNADSRLESEFVVMGLPEWLSQGNSYSVPSGDTTAQQNAIVAAAGVESAYKAWFGLN